MFGFGILVSLWPFHSWAPLGYAAAPTATAMLHAGVLKKFGLYGLIRVALPFLPDGARPWLQVLALLALGNILYCGLVALRQRNLNLLIGNSSVAHMGFVFLGIASLSLVGITGAVLVMIAHGLLAALTFALSGYLHQQLHTLEMSRMGGLLQRLPFIGTALIMALLAGCGLPGFANFPGEALVFFGSWKAFPVITLCAVWGALVLGGVYMLRAIRNLLHGPLAADCGAILDAPHAWRRFPFVLLLAALLAFGFFPAWLTDKIRPSVAEMLSKTSTAPIASRPADVATSTGFLGLSGPPHPDPLPQGEGTASRPADAVRRHPIASTPLGGALRRRIQPAAIVVRDARRSSLSPGERAGVRASPLIEVHPSMTSAGKSVRPQWAFASEAFQPE
jgi:NADH:ubiquinone oxidoreductase subunit 4 (subunit M)